MVQFIPAFVLQYKPWYDGFSNSLIDIVGRNVEDPLIKSQKIQQGVKATHKSTFMKKSVIYFVHNRGVLAAKTHKYPTCSTSNSQSINFFLRATFFFESASRLDKHNSECFSGLRPILCSLGAFKNQGKLKKRDFGPFYPPC